MSESGKVIFKNTVLLTSVEFFTLLMSLALIIVVGRKLGPEIMGIYAFAQSFIRLFEILCSFGLRPYIQREVSRNLGVSGKLMVQLFVLKTIIFLSCAIIIIIFDFFVIENAIKHQVIWILTGTMFFRINFTDTNAFFRAHQKANYEAAVRITLRLVYTSCGLVAILSGSGIVTLVSMEFVANMMACSVALGIYIKKIDNPFHYRISFKIMGELVRSTWEFMVLSLVQRMFNRVDMVMLSMMASDMSTGLYAVSVRLTDAFGFIPSAFTGAFFPALSRNALSNPKEFIKFFKPYLSFLLLLGSGFGAVIAGLSNDFIVLIFGKTFYEAGPTLALMAFALVLNFASWPFSTAIIALNKERQFILVFFISASSNIILNIVLIPLWQDQGAAIATILSSIILIILQFRVIGYNLLKQFQLGRLALGPLVTGCLTWCIILTVNSYGCALGWILTIAATSHILFAIITKTIDSKDLFMIRSLWRKKR